MSTSAQSVIRKATDLLQDPTSIRWPVDELVRWLNDAQLAICKVRPDAFLQTALATTSSTVGSRQVLGVSAVLTHLNTSTPKDDGTTFFPSVVYSGDIVGIPMRIVGPMRNHPNTSGPNTSSRRTITKVDRKVMDAGIPNWQGINCPSSNAEFLHYVHDEVDPLAFNLYPYPNGGSMLIEVTFVAKPKEISSPASDAGKTWKDVGLQSVSVPDVMADDLLNIILFKAYSKDSEFAGNAQRAQNYLTMATNSLGEELKSALGIAPKTPGVNSATK